MADFRSASAMLLPVRCRFSGWEERWATGSEAALQAPSGLTTGTIIACLARRCWTSRVKLSAPLQVSMPWAAADCRVDIVTKWKCSVERRRGRGMQDASPGREQRGLFNTHSLR